MSKEQKTKNELTETELRLVKLIAEHDGASFYEAVVVENESSDFHTVVILWPGLFKSSASDWNAKAVANFANHAPVLIAKLYKQLEECRKE